MADTVSPARRSEIMSGIRSRGTRPEMAVRRLLHSLGYRYRLHVAELPGKPDLVFPGRRKVIEVRGCFWHQHEDPECRIARKPRSNRDYWLPKLARNVERDAEHEQKLGALGWEVLVIWECEVRRGSEFLDRAVEFLEKR
ncbi:MAG: DNA mismatch endonuclease Vsr [Chloroflexota bacterium]|nr:DNA mismatch endonuclease Vsr [Chloroflexota bacterium]